MGTLRALWTIITLPARLPAEAAGLFTEAAVSIFSEEEAKKAGDSVRRVGGAMLSGVDDPGPSDDSDR